MARQKESLEMYLTEEQIEYIKSLPEEERQQATEDLLGIKRFANGAVDLTTVPGKKGDFFRKKQRIFNPERVRDEEGLFEKVYSDDNYFEATCPFCGTTAEHQGKRYHYSKKTKMLIGRDAALMALVAILVMLRVLNVILALVAITLITMDLANHARRKMFYTVTCRKCGAHFPLDQDEYDKLVEDLKAQAEAEAAEAEQEDEPEEEEAEETAETEVTEE
ncbi:MAG: hypothetical protein IKN20_00175 [Firmicutes bacterium]|nr:hypothetical protein [Bacillota bacterium]MBR3718267.1 hypothetical protein [Bacillota bacterium]